MSNTILNLIFLGVLLFTALVGAVFGFGKMLKATTRGIVGIAISITFCVLFGGALLATPAISGLVSRLNDYLYYVWWFLGVINLATVIYFIILFLVFQIARIIIVLIIKKVVEIKRKGIKIVNRILGALYLTVFVFTVFLLALAVLRIFEDYESGRLLFESIYGSWIHTIFRNNFIVFGRDAYYTYTTALTPYYSCTPMVSYLPNGY